LTSGAQLPGTRQGGDMLSNSTLLEELLDQQCGGACIIFPFLTFPPCQD
jgi:hypothetical protein